MIETAIELRRPVPDKEGRFAIVTNVGRGGGGRFGREKTNAREVDGQVVWS